ncbi:MAG: amylo-alpha-1,6-glucosidase [Bacteroidales bacterium]|nr:amylo-alpha-1,6-glucosidase [Bacteroidales bacterium]
MSYLRFEKSQLTNLEYALNRELIRTNRSGSFACTTIIGCHTRKYHGLLICPQPAIDDELHVLLSTLDETIIQHEAEFNLALHKFAGDTWYPRGHKYLVDFESDPIPALYYRVGGVQLKKEMMLASDDRLIIRYTLLDAHSPTKIRIRPFLAYRQRHHLSKANTYVEKKYTKIPGGIKLRMYVGYSYLHFQFSREVEYIHAPDWWYNFEYIKELQRGYEGHEDLYTPGYFEVNLVKKSPLYLSVGITPIDPNKISVAYSMELRKRTPRNSYENCLINAADQFIVSRDGKTEIIAGYPWFGRWGRDTFISLPGLTLTRGKTKIFQDVIKTMLDDLEGPLFPNVGKGGKAVYNSVDAPLWFFWSLQQLHLMGNIPKKQIWKDYSVILRNILNGLGSGKAEGIYMLENGLLFAYQPGKALTWMDAIVDGVPVTQRPGLVVEINALWYNAIGFLLELAEEVQDQETISQWNDIYKKIPISFKETFWDKSRGYLADYVFYDYKDWKVRPNMLFAASLPYSPLSEKIQQLIIEKVKNELLTPYGIRSLSPNDEGYKGTYEGPIKQRDLAYHQGTVWPWLLGAYADAYAKIYKKNAITELERIYYGMEPTLFEHGVGTIGEVFSGDPPHKPGGAISQAWSVAEVMRIKYIIDQLKSLP